MLAAAIAGVEEQRRRWVLAAERAIVANVGPEAPGHGFVLRQHRHGRVVAVEAPAGKTCAADQLDERRQRGAAGADPVGQRRDLQLDALAGIDLALPVQRLMLAELGIEDHRQQVRAGPAAGDRVEGRRRLGDRLAGAAGKLLPHGLDHLPLPRHHFQRLGDVLAQLGQLPAAGGARARRRDHDPLARQMRRQGSTHRTATHEARAPPCRSAAALGGDRALGRVGFEFLELQLQLVEHLAAALGGLAILLAPELGDQEPQMRDQGLRRRSLAPPLPGAPGARSPAPPCSVATSSGRSSGVLSITPD